MAEDAEQIFTRYAGDAEVTRYVGWPRARSIEDTRGFLVFSDAEWGRGPAGPYLIEAEGRIIGGTGLGFVSPNEACTGYVLAKDAWGCGYATESLSAMVALARDLGVVRLFALVHPDHTASRRVLQKCGFSAQFEIKEFEYPNLELQRPQPCLRYEANQPGLAQLPGR